jgi:hypothetical protein
LEESVVVDLGVQNVSDYLTSPFYFGHSKGETQSFAFSLFNAQTSCFQFSDMLREGCFGDGEFVLEIPGPPLMPAEQVQNMKTRRISEGFADQLQLAGKPGGSMNSRSGNNF